MSVGRSAREYWSSTEATRLRRFVLVGGAVAVVETGLLAALVELVAVQYLVAAAVCIEVSILVQYWLNNAWTFESDRHRNLREQLAGLARTNVVRASAAPLQLGLLYGLVSRLSLTYLVANAAAIVVAGTYRYVLESRWTWG